MTDDATTFGRVPDEVFNERKVDLIDEIFADDYVEHATPPGYPGDRDGLKRFVGDLLAAFPDFRYEILQYHPNGDTHIGYIRASGTMQGDFMGMPASKKSAAWEEMHIARMAGGKITEHWAVIDGLNMMRQLGFMPEPGS